MPERKGRETGWIHRALFGDRPLAEFVRFGLVGLQSNLLYYGLYLVLVLAGVNINIAVTIVFLLGAVYAFLFNRALVFRQRKHPVHRFAAFVAVYLAAWALNLYLLDVAVRILGVPANLAQLCLVFIISIPIFLSLKYLVFADRIWSRGSAERPESGTSVSSSERISDVEFETRMDDRSSAAGDKVSPFSGVSS